MKKYNYENETYLRRLEKLQNSYYSKYIDTIASLAKSDNSKILDVGCGSGKVIGLLRAKGLKNLYGVDISRLFIANAKKKGNKKVYKYDGTNLPFKNNSFDVIGSFNVLEHTQDPEGFIVDQIKKTKKGGYIIVACPNFLTAVFNSPHHRIKGFKNKCKNILRLLKKALLEKEVNFEKIKPIIRKRFQYDDDAIVITNLIDLKRLFKKNGCTITYESGFINFDKHIFKAINSIPLSKYILPSCFIIAKK